MRDLDLLVVGGAGIDTIVHIDSLPMPAADSIHVPPIRDYVAHTGNGVALASHTLGLKTQFLDVIGDDREGRLILERYATTGLPFGFQLHPAGTRRSVNLVDRKGRRQSFYDGRHPDGLRLPSDFYRPHLARTRHAHFSIMDWARHLYDEAQALDVPVSTDLHDWDGSNPYHLDFALRSELVFVSGANLRDNRQSVADKLLRDGRATAVIVMDGERGSHLATREQTSLQHIPVATPPGPVVDSNGAGDSFVAAFLWARLGGAGWRSAMEAGAIAGAFACTQHGTHEHFIDQAGLQAALESMK